MSVHVATEMVEINPLDYSADRRILSGDGANADDIRRGIRGISRAAAHAYAILGRTLYEFSEARGEAVATTTSTTGEQVTRDVPVVIGVGITELTIVANVDDGGVAVVYDGTPTAYSANVVGTSLHELTVAVTEGVHTLAVALRMHASQSEATLYNAIIRETKMEAADFP